MIDDLVILTKLSRYIGPRNVLRVLRQRFGRPRGGTNYYALRVAGLPDRLYFRPYTSDAGVFWCVFGRRQYSCLEGMERPGLIIDCGANVGYTAAYLLHLYPGCRLIAIEPDPGNFALLERNLASFGDRVELVRSGLWSRPARLAMDRSAHVEGQEWARRVRECGPDEDAEFVATDIASLLAGSGFDRISILKMDVEGAEVRIFSENFQSWIDRVDYLVVELHDEACEVAFRRAIGGLPFEVHRSGELTVCRPPPGSTPPAGAAPGPNRS